MTVRRMLWGIYAMTKSPGWWAQALAILVAGAVIPLGASAAGDATVDGFLAAPWALPLLSGVAVVGGYVAQTRSTLRLIERLSERIAQLEARVDGHTALPGHPVTIARLDHFESAQNEQTVLLRSMSTQIGEMTNAVARLEGRFERIA